jgi:hypothetical protein
VNKNFLIKAMQNYPSSSLEEAKEVCALKAAYPYSQVLRVLAARVCKEHSMEGQQAELQLAAVYSADRGVLKHMMSDQSREPMPQATAANIVASQPVQSTKTVKKEVEQPSMVVLPPDVGAEGDDLAETVIKDVQQLYNTRHNFEKMFVDGPVRHLAVSVRAGDETIKSKRERIIEMSKSLSAQSPKEGNVQPVSKKRRTERKDIIDEIATSKNEIEPANDKQKEQLDIIEHFILAQPNISNAKEKAQHIQEGDLSEIKTGEFGDNIVSETLVELLVKQGKKDKAVEVLKKLIWKFPQKKAYFAAQIEELKK